MKKYGITIFITLLTAFIIFQIRIITPIKNERLFQFPLNIGGWVGKKIPMEDRIFESLETQYSILIDYQSGHKPTINMAIVWYDDREIAFHGAAACLGGTGNKVKEDKLYYLTAPDGSRYEIGRLITDAYNIKRVVLYYYINDGYINGNQNKIRYNVLKKRIHLKRTSAAFVRIMAPIITSEENTQEYIEEFLLDTIPFVDEYTGTKEIIE